MNTGIAIELFVQHMSAAGLSASTIYVRERQLYHAARAIPVPLLTVSVAGLERYMAKQDWAPETRKSYRSSLRAFFNWATDAGIITVDPARKLPSVKVPAGEPKPITEEALALALSNANTEQRLMLMLGAYAGLRRAEIAQVHESHVSSFGLRVKGKGRRTRVVPIHPALSPLLASVDGLAFPSPVRKGSPVTPDYVHRRLIEVLPKPYSAHSLRHRFATRAYSVTRDLRAVQTLLGHSNPETTARYVLVPDDSLTAAVLGIQ
jgi:integrase/recombinase XerC